MSTFGAGDRSRSSTPVVRRGDVRDLGSAADTAACSVVIERDVARRPGSRPSSATSGVTTLWLTTALFNQIARALRGASRAVRQLLFGGEAVDPRIVRRVLRRRRPARLLNVLRSDREHDVSSLHASVRRGDATVVPIGRPIANTQLYVLDGMLQPGARRRAGRALHRRRGPARGYPEPPGADRRAVSFPTRSREPGRACYRTGDLVRWRADGALEFLGRLDSPGQAARLPHRARRDRGGRSRSIRRCARRWSLAREDSAGRRAAWSPTVVPADGASPIARRCGVPAATAARLHGAGASRRAGAAAADPERQGRPRGAAGARRAAALEQEFVAPARAASRSRSRQVWREVLRVERVGTDDNFFDLGGHSLLVVQVHAQLTSRRFGASCPIVDLFRFPTVESLARLLNAERSDRRGAERAPAAPASRGGSAGRPRDEAIAVIGMAGRFPGARDLSTSSGRTSATASSRSAVFTDEELRAPASIRRRSRSGVRRARARARRRRSVRRRRSSASARARPRCIDPQHRLFLECAWEALEDAGYDPDAFAGAVGVFAGVGDAARTCSTHLLANRELLSVRRRPAGAMIGNDKDFLATRVSYKLNLRGPERHGADRLLDLAGRGPPRLPEPARAGECDMALAGGVSIVVPQTRRLPLQEGGILSPDGHCRAFDADARGTVVGNGVGVVVLKRLADALADGDTIHAVIRGSAINNDGARKVGYTAPSVDGQAEVIATALAVAGVDAATPSATSRRTAPARRSATRSRSPR